MKKIKEWFLYSNIDWEMVRVVVIPSVVIIVGIILIIIGATYGYVVPSKDFDAAKWNANPVNPASPMHKILFH